MREIARAFGLKNDRPRRAQAACCATSPTRAGSGPAQEAASSPAPLPHVVLADVTGRDGDGELIADADRMGRGRARRGAAHPHPRPAQARSRTKSPASATARLLRTEETDEDDAIRHTGRVIKVLDRAKARALGIFRALPGGGGRLVPIDKKQLGRELAIPPARPRRTPRTATWSRSSVHAPGPLRPAGRRGSRSGSARSRASARSA